MEVSYNARCPAVKRLLKEAQELHEATEEYYAGPLEDNLFEWHFTVRGPPETEFEGGVYHGRIVMPAEYPMKPPNIIFFTPNGRFETNKKICLSISGHHPETWQPSWSIRTALVALIGFMPTPANGTIGSLDYTAAERAALAKKSVDFDCQNCGCVGKLLKERTGKNDALQQEAKDLSSQMVVTGKKDDFPDEAKPSTNKEQTKDSSQRYSTSRQSDIVASTSPSDQSDSPSVVVTSSTSVAEVVSPFPSPPISSSEHRRESSHQNSVALVANNIFLSAAVFLLIALVLRRLFLLEAETSEEMDILL